MYLKILIFFFPILTYGIFIFLKFKVPETYLPLIQEDSIVENMQALFYFLALFPAFLLSVKFLKNRMFLHGILYILFSSGLLFIALEEISWGQRIFNIESFTWFRQNNCQDEITLHNLNHIQPLLHALFITLGAFGSFAWCFMRFIRTKIKAENILNFVVPDWHLSSYFLFVLFIYGLYEYLGKRPAWNFVLKGDQEPPELLLAIGFLIFAVINYRKYAKICRNQKTCSLR